MEVQPLSLVKNLEPASRRVLRFLGLEWDPGILQFNQHAKPKQLRCGVDDAVASRIFTSSVGRWRHYQKYLEPCLKQLEPFINTFGYD